MPHLIDTDTGWCMLCQKYVNTFFASKVTLIIQKKMTLLFLVQEHDRLQRSRSVTSLDIESPSSSPFPYKFIDAAKARLKRSATAIGVAERITIQPKQNAPTTAPARTNPMVRKKMPILLTVPSGNLPLEEIKEEEDEERQEKSKIANADDDENYTNIYVNINDIRKTSGVNSNEKSKIYYSEKVLKKVGLFLFQKKNKYSLFLLK